MASTKGLQTTNLDFNQIKFNLVEFLKNQEAFKDYNFEGSGLSTIVDLLSYVTHYNAVNANFALNETFLDSAQLRESIVSHAKLLGYVPRSAYAPTAFVDITLNNPINITDDDGNFLTLIMPRGTQFTTEVSGQTYTFVTDETTSTIANESGEYVFNNVRLLQGRLVTTRYVYDAESAENYILPYEKAVTSTLKVSVQENYNSDEVITFTEASNIATITPDSEVYFLQESREGFYEVYFGDGVLGKNLENGNIIILEYLVTDGSEANNAAAFTLADSIEGNTNATVTVIERAGGGAEAEDTNSIKFNAPLAFVAQNRAVTPDDYKAIIQNSYPNIDAISVWGGEDNDPPDYGKVFISIKPRDKAVLSVSEKDFISAQYLKPKNVVSITPEFVDPTYTYLTLDVYYKYNPNTVDISTAALNTIVREAIRTYNDNELKRFDGVFRYSNLLNIVDESSPAVINSFARVFMNKRFVPDLTRETKYEITFSSPIYITSSNEQIISSSQFIYNGLISRFEDVYNAFTGERRIQIVTGTGDDKVVVSSNEGYVDAVNGKVILNGFVPDSLLDDYITITASPNSNDIAPKRNELLEILVDSSLIYGEVDTMIVGGTSAGVNYTTTPRHR